MLSLHSRSTEKTPNSIIKDIKEVLESKDLPFQAEPKIEFEKYIAHSSYSPVMYFPFSNEHGFDQTLQKFQAFRIIQQYEMNTDKKPRLAFLTGESNLLSLLPEMEGQVDFIICNDIDKAQHIHIKHLLDTIQKANSVEEFLKIYKKELPINEIKVVRPALAKLEKKMFIKKLNESKLYVKTFHFLSSKARFIQCKNASENLTILHARLNLFDRENCQAFADQILKQCTLKFLGLTNLHDYDSKNILEEIVTNIFKIDRDTKILYSTGGIAKHATLTSQIAIYFKIYKQHLRNEQPPLALTIYPKNQKSLIDDAIELYDNKKGLGRKYLYSDSKAMRKIKDIQKVMQHSEANYLSLPHQLIYETKATVDFYLNNKKGLTNKFLLQLHNFLYGNITHWDQYILLTIGLYLDRSGVDSFGKINKQNYKLFQLKKSENQSIGFKLKTTSQISSPVIFGALISCLNEYKIERDKRYNIRNLFYKDQTLLNRIKNLRNDLWYLAKNTEEIDFNKLTNMLGYQSVSNQERYDNDTYLTKALYFSNHFKNFFLSMYVPKEAKSDIPENNVNFNTNTLLLTRLLFEINYAVSKHHHRYHETLLEMAGNFLLSEGEDCKAIFHALKDDAIKRANDKIKLYKAPDYWNRCYVWKGKTNKFQPITASTAKEADKKYDNDTIYREYDEYISDFAMSSEFSTSTASSGGRWVKSKELVEKGLDCKLRHFFMFRDRCEVFEDLIKIFNKADTLLFDCKSKSNKKH